MITVGLTGSIGMGKSTVANMFAELGAAIWDADAAVHRLYAPGGDGVLAVKARFPQAVIDRGDGECVDRERLSSLVVGDDQALKDLEQIVHPLVAMDRLKFGEEAAKTGADVLLLDIPLLYENGTDQFLDAVIVVSAPFELQKERVLQRPGMTAEKFKAILDKQMPDADKRAKADFIVNTDQTIAATKENVGNIWRSLLRRGG